MKIKKLRSYISLVLAEIQLVERISEIKQNFTNPSDFNRITMPMLDRISKIKSRKKAFRRKPEFKLILILLN